MNNNSFSLFRWIFCKGITNNKNKNKDEVVDKCKIENDFVKPNHMEDRESLWKIFPGNDESSTPTKEKKEKDDVNLVVDYVVIEKGDEEIMVKIENSD
jgi:hypothetical protein